MEILDRRIGRLGFLLGQIPVVAVDATFHAISGTSGVRVNSAVGVRVVAALAWDVLITMWRCHDFDKSLWSNFWTEQLPVVGPFLGAWDLITTPGSPGFNTYGRPPKL